jgi:multiple sugar transport system permease protein
MALPSFQVPEWRETLLKSAAANSKPTKKSLSLSEKQVGFLMILPALAVILVIAIWPVIRSFYLSTFDLRLNDPTKREAFVSYSINVDTYSDNFDSMIRTFDFEIKKADDPVKTELQTYEDTLQQMHKLLMADPQFAAVYDRINKLRADLAPIPKSLQYYTIDKETGKKLIDAYGKIDAALAKLQNQDLLQKPKDIVGAFHLVNGSVIKPNFVGMDNYKHFLQDKRMWNSLWNTVTFTVLSVAAEFLLGLGIALLINKNFKGRGLIRASVLVPWAIPTVISAKMWLFMYNGEYGIMAKLFQWIGLLSDSGKLLTEKHWQMFAVIFADVWKTTPFMALLLLAGLQMIPSSLYEAARVDGASKWQQFANITMPMLKGTILVALLFRTLDAFRVFDLIYVLLGRSQSSEVISTYAYQTMFAQTEFGAGSALSVIVFLCVAVISILFIRLLGTDLLDDKR